jgi:hypothetical protein
MQILHLKEDLGMDLHKIYPYSTAQGNNMRHRPLGLPLHAAF